MAIYTNVTSLVDRSRANAKRLADAMNEARAIEAEYIRIGGEARVSPYFFTLDDPPVLRTDVPFSLSEFVALMSAFKVLSAGADNGLPGLAVQIDAQWAVIDRIKNGV